MNLLVDNQTSGNDWGPLIQPMLHERAQESPIQWPAITQRSILKDFEEEMAHFEREYQAHIKELRRLYVLPSDGSVVAFLNVHRALPPILISAMPQLRRIFRDTVFALRADSDEYGWENLYVDALWSRDAYEAFHLLDRFSDEWWIANSRPARGALTFTYRLV